MLVRGNKTRWPFNIKLSWKLLRFNDYCLNSSDKEVIFQIIMLLLKLFQYMFLAGPKGQLFTLQCPSLTHLLTHSLRQKSSNLIDAIVVTRERRIVGIKVRKQGPFKIKFKVTLFSDILTYDAPLRSYRDRVESVIQDHCVKIFPTA